MSLTTLSSLVVILAVAAAAPIVSDLISGKLPFPSVVLELGAGIMVGPILGWAHEDDVIGFLADFGLAALMFLAGLEIDIDRVKGPPARRALTGWLLSLALGLVVGFSLADIHGTTAGLVIGLAITTTALGTLLPILRDSGELDTPFGTEVLAGAAIGELGPVVAVSVVLTTDTPGRTTVVLLGFVAVALLAAAVARRPRGERLARLIDTTLMTSGQLAVRLVVLFLAALVWVAAELGLDVLLGAFAAGMVFRVFSAGASEREAELVEAKLHALGFGFFIPIFFVVSGIRFDTDAVADQPLILLGVPLILLGFLLVRGGPHFFLVRAWPMRDRLALSCYLGTELPLVVVITGIGVQSDRLGTGPAAALVTTAMVSVLVLPQVAARLRAPTAPPA